jgi:zinc protease
MNLRVPFLVTTALAFLSSPARADNPAPAGLPVLPAETVQLSNGLRVLLAPDPSAQLVSVVVSYAAGSADDPNGRKGLAHLTEHFVSRRTEHVDRPLRALELAGAWFFNATTDLDTTTFFETLPAEHLETALWIESDRMGYAATAADEQTLREEREVVRNEDRDRTVDGMLASVSVTTTEELYPGWHPYSASAEGATDLDRIRVEDVRAFLDTWYSPANATLAIAGRFDREETLALVKRYFESLPSPAAPARPVLPAWNTPSVLLEVKAPVSADGVVLEWRTPALGEKDDAALDMAAAILARGGNERLAPALVAEHLATGVQAMQRSLRRESVFIVSAAVAPQVDAGLVADKIQDVIDGLAREVTQVEVERAHRLWRGNTFAQIETTFGRARWLASLASTGVEPGPGFDWGFGRYESVHEAEVTKAVGKWLGLAHRVGIVVLGDRSAPRRGRLVRRQEVTP